MVLMRFYSGIVMDSPTDCLCFLFFTYHYLFDHYVYILLLLFVSIIITTIIVIITIIIVTIIIIIYCLIFEEPSTRFEKKELIASFSGRYCSIFFGASIVIL